ncbi:MAG TPA: hypothetical protein VK020_09365, partial [Microlunatus sp.]|nr:hypothetical protein [Microlunatus sp.]
LGCAAATAIAATTLVATPTTAEAGITCTTTKRSTPVHAKPWRTAPIVKRLAKGTDLACTDGPTWIRVGGDGEWYGYVHRNFLDLSFG